MEQNTPKFRLKLNIFDIVILVVALAVAAVLLFLMRTPEESVGPTTTPITYTVRFDKSVPAFVDAIEVGDQLKDSAKNLALGTVVSVTSQPYTTRVLNEETLTETAQPVPDLLTVDILISADAYIANGGDLFLASGYEILAPNYCFVSGPGYLSAGRILIINREGLK